MSGAGGQLVSTRGGAIMETGDLNGMAGLLPVNGVNGQADQLHHQQADSGVQSVEVRHLS